MYPLYEADDDLWGLYEAPNLGGLFAADPPPPVTFVGSAAITLERMIVLGYGSTPMSQALVDRRMNLGGMEPPTRPAERRDFFDVRRVGRTIDERVEFLEESFIGAQSGTYTPTLVGMAIGTGGSATNTASYWWTGGPDVGDEGLLFLSGWIIFGTAGATFPTTPDVLLPPGFRVSAAVPVVQRVQAVHYFIAAVGFVFGFVEYQASANDRIRLGWLNAAGTPLGLGALSPVSPGAWAAGDSMRYGVLLPTIRV